MNRSLLRGADTVKSISTAVAVSTDLKPVTALITHAATNFTPLC